MIGVDWSTDRWHIVIFIVTLAISRSYIEDIIDDHTKSKSC